MTISYPDLGFAFNPIRIIIENYTQGEAITLESSGVTIQREPIAGTDNLTFELAAIAKSLFDRLEFPFIQEQDTTLLKTLNFTLSNSSGVLLSGSIPVLWGALQIGEKYTQNKTLTYFKGFPFTVPLYTEGEIVLKANGVEYKTIGPGKHNLDISDINSSVVIEAFNEYSRKVFDYTFDFTFGPQKVLTPNNLKIKVNVVDCPNEGVYLRWINKYAEYNYYLFGSGVSSSTTRSIDIAYENIYYTTDLTDNYHFGTGKNIGKDIDQTIKLYAPLVDSDTFDFLLSLAESPVVDMFTGYDSTGKANWISISILDGTFAKSTSILQDFELFLVPNLKQVQTL